jgi:hypothetical protein
LTPQFCFNAFKKLCIKARPYQISYDPLVTFFRENYNLMDPNTRPQIQEGVGNANKFGLQFMNDSVTIHTIRYGEIERHKIKPKNY